MELILEASNKNFTKYGGLFLGDKLWKKLDIESKISPCLPSLKSGKGRSINKFRDMVFGFMLGAECLDDMDELATDGAFSAACSNAPYCSKSFGDYLRSFDGEMIAGLNRELAKLSFRLSKKIENSTTSVFDCDSTYNRQYGKKMQGVELVRKVFIAYDSVQVFDELGFCYHHDVRPGNVGTSHNISGVIHSVIDPLKDRVNRVILRADRGYCNSEAINACEAKGLEYVIGFVKHSNFPEIADQVHKWTPCDPNEKIPLVFYDGRECEIGSTFYKMEKCLKPSRLVILRAKKKVKEGFTALFDGDVVEYDYFAFATNTPDVPEDIDKFKAVEKFWFSDEELVRFYRLRGNSENFIKECKYGFDLKHYPCQKLDANRAYGIIATFAHNLMRFLSLTDNRNTPHFSKYLRDRFLCLPAQVVRRGRQVFFKIKKRLWEVQQLMKKINSLIAGFT